MGKSETVSSRTVTTEQPHRALVPWRRTPRSGLHREARRSPCLVRTPMSLSGLSRGPWWQGWPARGAVLTSCPRSHEAHPGSPTLRAPLRMALPHPLPLGLAGNTGTPPFSAGVPLLAVSEGVGDAQGSPVILFGHQERNGVGTLGVGWAHTRRTPPLQVAFLWCQAPSPPKLRASSRALDRASQCQPPSWAQSHPPIQGEGHILLPTGPGSTCPPRRGAQATLPCLLPRAPPPPAISQGRAQCPLYMRLHDGSAGASLSPQTLK